MSLCSAHPFVRGGWPLVSILLCLLGSIGPAVAENRPLDAYARVSVAPTKTSIYVGRVSLKMTTFERADGRYSSSYSAKVFPYFFYSESGQLSVEISDEALGKLERGQVIEFQGRAVTTGGDERRITGRAIPESVSRGKIKVRVALPGGVELIFNTTYAFVGR